ncbi:MmcQ/YjbR family DNA-binding protein [Enterococcus saccharolyticus]|uniref:MmcQ/YjbR family DNA-binding protein n=1 Tax=Enterococcus saccharolyticus TaxID=41997 RepID=UPI001E53A2B7|nr:MmcQ/YjbR family DNA-binding protein [Enterococcus saccharolyticus]MCD5001299.1 MmcQ/YjbR family DNA-binding protein [Enterococcus saccharolyticus]
MKQRMERLQRFGASLPFAKVYFREDWATIYFEVHGKMFGTMSPQATEQAMITLKGLPEKNEELREIYEDITPGYHMNKKHWNSIALRSTVLTDEEFEQMIYLSYQLVWQNLPAKIRQAK